MDLSPRLLANPLHHACTQGCKSGVSSAFRTYLAVIIALAIMVALIEVRMFYDTHGTVLTPSSLSFSLQLIAVLLAIGLCCSGKKDSYETV